MDPIGNAEPRRERAVARDVWVVREALGLRPTGDDQLAARHARYRRDHVPDALPLDEPADDDDAPEVARPRLRRAVGPENVEVDAAWHDVDPARVGAEPDQLEQLAGARGDDAVGVAEDPRLDVESFGGARVLDALVSLLHDAERMERLQHRYAQRPCGVERCETGHPEVGVHQRRLPRRPRPAQVMRELRHVRQQLVLRQVDRRSGVDVLDRDAGRDVHARREIRVVPPRVHGDRGSALRDRRRERRHVHVLASRVDTAERRERARVLGHHRDLHPPQRFTSSNIESQSRRNRLSP